MTKLKTEGVTLGWMPGWVYDGFISALTHGKETSLRNEILDIANIQPGEKVLDVGCGTGTLAILAAEKALESDRGLVVGIDPCSNLIKRAEKKARKHFKKKKDASVPSNLEWKQGLAEDMPAEDDTFDVLLCTFTLHHLPGDELQTKVLEEMMRVLVPGGRLLIVDFAGGRHGHHGPHNSKKVVNVDNDPALLAVKKAKFEGVAAQKVQMMGAVAVAAKKPMSKGEFLASLKSNVIMGSEDEENVQSKGQLLASLESDLIMGERDDDPEHKRLSKGEFIVNLPSSVM